MAGLNAPATSALVTLDVADGVATIAMRDAAGRNALGPELVSGLRAAFQRSGDDPAVRVAVLSGLPDIFSSGATRAVLEGILSGDVPLAELDLPRLLLDCPVPVVAAMEGDAIGGGFALALAADVIVMAERSRYGLNFMDYGLTPGMGATLLARDVLGRVVAEELMYSGEFRRGGGFRGIVNHVAPRELVLERAQDVAARIAGKPRSALVLLKRALVAGRLAAFDVARETETRLHRECLRSPELAERIRSHFPS